MLILAKNPNQGSSIEFGLLWVILFLLSKLWSGYITFINRLFLNLRVYVYLERKETWWVAMIVRYSRTSACCEWCVCVCVCVCVCYVCVTQSCPTLCNHMDYSPPGSSVHGISFSRGSSQPRGQTWVSYIGGRFFTVWVSEKPYVGDMSETKILCKSHSHQLSM